MGGGGSSLVRLVSYQPHTEGSICCMQELCGQLAPATHHMHSAVLLSCVHCAFCVWLVRG